MWGGIKGVVGALFSGELFKGGENQAVAQGQVAPSPKVEQPPRQERPVRHRAAPLPAPSVIMNLLRETFQYPETKEALLVILHGRGKERKWLDTAPQENVDRLLADIQRMKASDEASNRKERVAIGIKHDIERKTRMAETKAEADEAREAMRFEATLREQERRIMADTIAEGVRAGIEADRRNRR